MNTSEKLQPEPQPPQFTPHEPSNDGHSLTFLLLSGLSVLLVAHFVFRRVMRITGAASRPRHSVLLLGLCGGGKTALFAQLLTGRRVATRTSMQPNTASLNAVAVVDFPGHRRLRESLLPAVAEAKRVVVVVDAVAIQDDRNEGAKALAELLLSVCTSPAFYGVEAVLMACTKRDELTSYSARAVRKLLEAEVSRCVATRRGDVQSVEAVVNDAGVAVGQKRKRRDGGRAHVIELSASDKFNFDSFAVPVSFADVSAFPDGEKHQFGVEEVRQFVLGTK